jgi:hypothetical protein
MQPIAMNHLRVSQNAVIVPMRLVGNSTSSERLLHGAKFKEGIKSDIDRRPDESRGRDIASCDKASVSFAPRNSAIQPYLPDQRFFR